ncbi:tRNA (guanine-N(7)-)-methyltransferase non-catalytic subunit trm82 [Vermiconidia calcicola]|uniref:tRNA (Guanine-N(7)-)-methyltransferase non-catalytic subunit trm82 n=1 Tax=Vermiconidia calcicola TaxID=1690605 RepID=A0ACC3NP73_9PEZI|nr:tRNA (guanine-N(7)-)-methyltransferase non-catalytic subunit trm82 [Vermiconidia calcicola]
MNHPFQLVEIAKPPAAQRDHPGYLLAACGSKLLSTCLATGNVVSEWTADVGSGQVAVSNDTESTHVGGSERPAKKQKTGNASLATAPNVIKLAISPNHQHAVAVTDDKCVRVFEIHAEGKLLELSQRTMPKRPCAVQVLPDNATIICGDKFGDVYSLPLLLELKAIEDDSPMGSTESHPPQQEASTPFKPSASMQTVHTKRNRKALEAQLKQKNLTPKSKAPLQFDHKVLLGHVSMLTDVAYASREVDGKQRGYIITADRDEHIRISRAPPQSHVIEGYCLGHREFVSKVCVIPGTDLLVSGGGDDWLGIWQWPAFKLLARFDQMRALLHDLIAKTNGSNVEDQGNDKEPIEQIAVSGIWIVPATGQDGTSKEHAVIVACEKVPALFYCPVSKLLEQDAPWNLRQFRYPILDITSVGTTTLVSLDVRGEEQQRIVAYRLKMQSSGGTDFQCDEETNAKLMGLDCVPSDIVDAKGLEDLLYGAASLRKRGHQDEDVAEEAG